MTFGLVSVLKPGTTLYLIRHGETDWNRDQRYQGQRDIPLNETGRAQARRNGETLKSLLPSMASIDFISSPMQRAVETMQIIRGELALPVNDFAREPQIVELSYGHWEGQLATELAKFDPGGLARKTTDPFGWRPKDGESYSDLKDRIDRWLPTIVRDTVVVTHGGVSRVVRATLCGAKLDTVPFLDVPQDRILVIQGSNFAWH